MKSQVNEEVEPNSGRVEIERQEQRNSLYGVGGEVYTFIHVIRGVLEMHNECNMAHRAQELLDKIAANDRDVEEIARRVTEECRQELAREHPLPQEQTK